MDADVLLDAELTLGAELIGRERLNRFAVVWIMIIDVCFALLWEGWLYRLLFQACASTSGWILGLIGRFSYVSQSNLMGMV